MRIETSRGDVFEVMTPVMEPLEQILRTQEAWCEEQGWDQRPSYFLLTLSQVGMMLGSIHWMPDEMYENPAEYLGEFAEFVGSSPMAKLIFGRVLPRNYHGIVCFHEAWMRSAATREELEDGLRPSEAPDRQEIRTGLAATVDGRIAMVTRIRNQPPPVFQEVGVDTAAAGGRLIDGMRLLCDNLEKVARA